MTVMELPFLYTFIEGKQDRELIATLDSVGVWHV